MQKSPNCVLITLLILQYLSCPVVGNLIHQLTEWKIPCYSWFVSFTFMFQVQLSEHHLGSTFKYPESDCLPHPPPPCLAVNLCHLLDYSNRYLVPLPDGSFSSPTVSSQCLYSWIQSCCCSVRTLQERAAGRRSFADFLCYILFWLSEPAWAQHVFPCPGLVPVCSPDGTPPCILLTSPLKSCGICTSMTLCLLRLPSL